MKYYMEYDWEKGIEDGAKFTGTNENFVVCDSYGKPVYTSNQITSAIDVLNNFQNFAGGNDTDEKYYIWHRWEANKDVFFRVTEIKLILNP